MARKRKVESSAPGSPAWMMTYGDLVTQMLTFFILLFTFSTIDAVRFRDAVISLQGAFGVLSGGPQILNLSDLPSQNPLKIETAPAETPILMVLQEQIQQAIEEEEQQEKQKEVGLQKDQEKAPLISTQLDERGLRISFTDKALFDLGKADLRSDAIPVLTNVAEIIQPIPNRIQVEGHTDNIPIHSGQFKSNWELSTARATAVVHFLIQEGGILPEKLTASGYGEFHPIVLNDCPENRQKNRRVEILILNEEENINK